MNRRAFLRGSAALAPLLVVRAGSAQQPLPGEGETGRLRDPSAVQRRDPTSELDNDAYIQALEKRLKCNCGCNLDVYTCRTTDFTCQTSPALHRQVMALHEAGKTADEIVADFVGRYGEEALMAPKPEGFNLAGYLVPGVLIVLVGGLLAWRLTRVSAPRPAPAPEPEAPGTADALTAEERALLDDALARVED